MSDPRPEDLLVTECANGHEVYVQGRAVAMRGRRYSQMACSWVECVDETGRHFCPRCGAGIEVERVEA